MSHSGCLDIEDFQYKAEIDEQKMSSLERMDNYSNCKESAGEKKSNIVLEDGDYVYYEYKKKIIKKDGTIGVYKYKVKRPKNKNPKGRGKDLKQRKMRKDGSLISRINHFVKDLNEDDKSKVLDFVIKLCDKNKKHL